MRVLICGGGVIGTATAYYLAALGAEPVIIERAGIANAASGKSGGFLALDWCDGTPLGPLARRSFVLHKALAETLPSDYGYRTLDTLSVTATDDSESAYAHPALLNWLADAAIVRGRLGTTETTAQVHPASFTKALADAAVEQGGRTQVGEVTGIQLSAKGSAAKGVVVGNELLEGDAVVIAMGPWSILACNWLPLPPVYGLKGHSIVLRPAQPVSPHALFVDVQDHGGNQHSPEVFPRPDGSVYICGLSGTEDLPVDPNRVATDAASTDRLLAITKTFAPQLAQAEVIAAQACYRPVTTDGLPLLGRVEGLENVYVSTGHSCWGILNAPASGEAMAQLVTAGTAETVDLRPFDPRRLGPSPRSAAAE